MLRIERLVLGILEDKDAEEYDGEEMEAGGGEKQE